VSRAKKQIALLKENDLPQAIRVISEDIAESSGHHEAKQSTAKKAPDRKSVVAIMIGT